MTSFQKLQLIEKLQQIRKKQLEESFYLFVTDAFEVLHPGQYINDNWHIKYICDLLQPEIERISREERKTHDMTL
jgi:hypothetical protein